MSWPVASWPLRTYARRDRLDDGGGVVSSEGDVLVLAKTAFKAGQLTTMPLFSVDPLALAQSAHEELEKQSFDVAPVEDGSSYYRYVQREWLPSEGKVQDFAMLIEAIHMIPSTTPLADCLKKLTAPAWYFVLEREEVTGLITLADLQKPALSLFAFANVLALEAYVKSAIAEVEDWLSS